MARLLPCALLLFSVVGLVLAQHPHHPEDETELEEKEREVKVEVLDNSATLRSRTKAGDSRNEYQVRYKVEDGRLRVDLQAWSRLIDSDGAHDQSKYRFQVKFEGLVEYKKSTTAAAGDVAYDPSRDTTVQAYRVGKSPITIASLPDITEGANVIKRIDANSADGVFKIRGYLSPLARTVGNETFSPNFHKFDIIIDPIALNVTSSDSRVALVARVLSSDSSNAKQVNKEGEQTSTATKDAKTVRFGAGAVPFALFTWAQTVDVTSQSDSSIHTTADVVVSPLVTANDGGALKPRAASMLLMGGDGDGSTANETADHGSTGVHGPDGQDGVDEADGYGNGEHKGNNDNNKRVVFSFDSLRPGKIVWDPAVGMGAGVADNGTGPRVVAAGWAVALLALAVTSVSALLQY